MKKTDLARRYRVSEKTIYNWRDAGAPVDDVPAMDKWFFENDKLNDIIIRRAQAAAGLAHTKAKMDHLNARTTSIELDNQWKAAVLETKIKDTLLDYAVKRDNAREESEDRILLDLARAAARAARQRGNKERANKIHALLRDRDRIDTELLCVIYEKDD